MSYKIVTSDGRSMPNIIADMSKAYERKTKYQIAHPNMKFQVVPAKDIWDTETKQWVDPEHKKSQKKTKKRNLFYV